VLPLVSLFHSLELDPESDVTLFENVITSEKRSREAARAKLEGVECEGAFRFHRINPFARAILGETTGRREGSSVCGRAISIDRHGRIETRSLPPLWRFFSRLDSPTKTEREGGRDGVRSLLYI